MRAITLTQPWATLVAIGAKRIETRSWSTTYRGPLAIHAAKGLGPVGGQRGLSRQCHEKYFYDALNGAGYAAGVVLWTHLPFGAIVATCELVDCVSTSGIRVVMAPSPNYIQIGSNPLSDPNCIPLTEQEFAFGDYSAGRWAWILTNIKPLPTPIPAKGALGLWDWEPPA